MMQYLNVVAIIVAGLMVGSELAIAPLSKPFKKEEHAENERMKCPERGGKKIGLVSFWYRSNTELY